GAAGGAARHRGRGGPPRGVAACRSGVGPFGGHRRGRVSPVVLPMGGIAPVDVEVRCDGALHVARFEHGRLRLVAHDADAERALVALGGDAPTCLALTEAWVTAVRTLESGGLHPLDGLRRLDKDVPAPEPWEPPAG